MEKMIINETVRTPLIVFDPEQGVIELRGRSTTENAKRIYKPLVDVWLDKYIKTPQATTTVNIELEYYNTSSSMWLLRLLKKMETLHNHHHKVVINWYYADEDMQEAGEDYQELVFIPFNMVETE